MTPDEQQADFDWDAWIESRRDLFERRASFNEYVGLLLEAAGPGWARMRLDLRPDVMNPFGAVHGGAVCALIDSAAGSAIAASMPGDDRIRGTIDMQVHFLERARGTALIAEGRVVRTGRAVAVATVDVRDDAQALVAMGTATFRLGTPGSRRNED
ncbi:MAG TPA: PaaI family thioesterase [Dehalococcoidia bacterium]